MNREALPLIIGVFLPIILVISIILYISGYDITEYFRKIDIIYYIIVLPFGLGFLVVILWYKNPKN